MANRTDPLSAQIHSTDPQHLIEAILRHRIYDCMYWKEKCFGLTAETLIDRAIEINYIGSTYSHNSKATPFICLVLKLLQIQPDKAIIMEYIKQEDYKYLRALGLFYLRLTSRPVEVYTLLEPYLTDYRKLASRSVNGWSVTHMDEFVDQLLTEERVCNITLPYIPKRLILQKSKVLEPRKSPLDHLIHSNIVTTDSTKGATVGTGDHEKDFRNTNSNNAISNNNMKNNDDDDEEGMVYPIIHQPPIVSSVVSINDTTKNKDNYPSNTSSSSFRMRDDQEGSYRNDDDHHRHRQHISRSRERVEDSTVYHRDHHHHRHHKHHHHRRHGSRSRSRSRSRSPRHRHHHRRSRSRSRSNDDNYRPSHHHHQRQDRSDRSSAIIENSIPNASSTAPSKPIQRIPGIKYPGGTTSSSITLNTVISTVKSLPVEGSVEYWNQIRAGLNMKPLKE